MEKLVNCEIVVDIELIELISGRNQEFEVLFSTKDGDKRRIIFDFVWDMRYSIENASIDRFCQLRKYLSDSLVDSSIYIVENSDYVTYFENQVSGTRPTNKLKHYILYDSVDTTLDILTIKEPILIG